MSFVEKFVRSLILFWALLGGFLLFLVVFLNTFSVAGGIVGNPIPGDFELTEMGVAIAVFAFLPYCQLTNANVTADIFTSRASPRWLSLFGLVSSLVALLFSILLFWCMSQGMVDRYNYQYTSAILLIPMWIPYVPVLFSWVLLLLAAIISVKEFYLEFNLSRFS